MIYKRVYINQNFSFKDNILSYYYKIKPINSFYTSDKQLEILVSLLTDILLDINMPGSIIIKPTLIDKKDILNYQAEKYERYGNKDLKKLFIRSQNEINEQLNNPKYRYDIYLIFCDGRENIKKKTFKFFKEESVEPSTALINIAEVVSEEIFNKLKANLVTTKLENDEIINLLNYCSIPVENKNEFYTTPNATYIEYNYKEEHKYENKKLLSRCLIVNKIDINDLSNTKAILGINKLQLFPFPVDTFIKFELEHTNKFKQEMTAKREIINKAKKLYRNTAEREDIEAHKAYEISAIGKNVDNSIEHSKIRFQIQFRIFSADEKIMEKKTDQIIRFLEGSKLICSYEIGEQESLHLNLFPENSNFKKYCNLTDVSFFSKFNFLGGLFIGEEKNGVYITRTQPGNLPVIIDIEAAIKGNSKSSAPTTVFVGETGSGKTQISNNIVLLSLIFYGHKVLVIDPKNDRLPIIDYLNQFGNIAKKIVIGGSECPSGIFDPFLINCNDNLKALDQAKSDIIELIKAVNKNDRISLSAIELAYKEMFDDFEKGVIKRMTLTNLTKYLENYEYSMYDTLSGLINNENGRLFFGNDTTDINYIFDMSCPYNLVTYDKIPIYDTKSDIKFNQNSLEHNIFAIVLKKIENLTSNFMREDKEKAKTLQIDEVRIFSACPGGTEVIVNVNLMCRSHLTNLHLILQNWSELPTSVLNNTGQYFIGNMKSDKEIELILKHFKLENHSSLKKILEDSTSEEGLDTTKKYRFLYCDYNNRKSVTKMEMLKSLTDVFNTYKKE